MELLFILLSLFIATLIGSLVKERGVIEFTSIIASVVAFAASVFVAFKVASMGTYAFSLFSVDALGAIVTLIISFIGLLATCYSVVYLRQETTKHIIGFTRVREYFVLLNLFMMAMFFAVFANNPVLTWISIEATTLSTAFLISFYNKPSAMEAAWKYLVINSVGLLLGFFGTLLYLTAFTASGENAFVTWTHLLAHAEYLDPLVAKIAFIFILIGYGTKAGFAPMHTWLPDAHSKAPAPISALLSGVLLNVAFITILRFKAVTDLSIGVEISEKLLIAFGLLSIFVAAFILFTQKSYKRMLAYSSIENMGIIALGFGFGGLGVFAAILHMIYHSLIKSALFMLSGNVLLRYNSAKILNVRGALTAIPVTSIFFLIGIFAITGMPPFGIFLTKIFILSAGMHSYPLISVAAIFFFAIVFISLFKYTHDMIFGEKPNEINNEKENIWLIAPSLILFIVVLYLSFYLPSFLRVLINNALTQF